MANTWPVCHHFHIPQPWETLVCNNDSLPPEPGSRLSILLNRTYFFLLFMLVDIFIMSANVFSKYVLSTYKVLSGDKTLSTLSLHLRNFSLSGEERQ